MKNNGLSIRRGTLADIDGILEVEERSFTTDLISKRSLRWLITRGNASLWVCIEKTSICGAMLLLYHKNRKYSRLYSLAVAPEAQGRGIGTAFLRVAQDDARSRGLPSIRLEVGTTNRGAQALYEKAGFRKMSIIKAFYEDGSDAYRYEYSLS